MQLHSALSNTQLESDNKHILLHNNCSKPTLLHNNYSNSTINLFPLFLKLSLEKKMLKVDHSIKHKWLLYAQLLCTFWQLIGV